MMNEFFQQVLWCVHVTGGHVENRLISTVLFPHLGLCMTQRRKFLTGTSSVSLLVWREKQMKVWRDIFGALCLCVVLPADYHQGMMKVEMKKRDDVS